MNFSMFETKRTALNRGMSILWRCIRRGATVVGFWLLRMATAANITGNSKLENDQRTNAMGGYLELAFFFLFLLTM